MDVAMDQAGTVLAVTSNIEACSAPLGVLSDQHDYRVLPARSPAEAFAALSNAHVDLVIVEDGHEGVALLSGLRISHPDIVRIIVVGSDSHLSRQALSAASIYQFVREPLDAAQLGLLIKRALETRELARRHRLLSREFKFPGDSDLSNGRNGIASRESQSFEKLVYVSEKMAELCDLARRAAKTELPILIQGETGTGKELLARAIHYNSSRRSSPLMIQNCGGVPDELLQSELFGHKRGAFTSATVTTASWRGVRCRRQMVLPAISFSDRPTWKVLITTGRLTTRRRKRSTCPMDWPFTTTALS
jgi:two-component system, NtrC family, response regulator HupR/HoxA